MEEVESAATLAQYIEKLELPNQLVAVLADPVLQKVLILRPNVEAYQRVANWLDAVLQDVLDGNTDIDTLWEVLEVVKEFVVQTRVSHPWSRTNVSLMIFHARLYRLSFSTFLPSFSNHGMA